MRQFTLWDSCHCFAVFAEAVRKGDRSWSFHFDLLTHCDCFAQMRGRWKCSVCLGKDEHGSKSFELLSVYIRVDLWPVVLYTTVGGFFVIFLVKQVLGYSFPGACLVTYGFGCTGLLQMIALLMRRTLRWADAGGD